MRPVCHLANLVHLNDVVSSLNVLILAVLVTSGTDGGGGKTAEMDPGVDNLLPRVGLPVVDEQEEAAKEITADQQRQHDSKRYRSCNNVNINIIVH